LGASRETRLASKTQPAPRLRSRTHNGLSFQVNLSPTLSHTDRALCRMAPPGAISPFQSDDRFFEMLHSLTKCEHSSKCLASSSKRRILRKLRELRQLRTRVASKSVSRRPIWTTAEAATALWLVTLRTISPMQGNDDHTAARNLREHHEAFARKRAVTRSALHSQMTRR